MNSILTAVFLFVLFLAPVALAEDNTPSIQISSIDELRRGVIKGDAAAFISEINTSLSDASFAKVSRHASDAMWSRFMIGAMPILLETVKKENILIFYNPFVDEAIVSKISKGSTAPNLLLYDMRIVDGPAFAHAYKGTPLLQDKSHFEILRMGFAARVLVRIDESTEMFSKIGASEGFTDLSGLENYQVIALKLVSNFSEPLRLSPKEIKALGAFLDKQMNTGDTNYPSWLTVDVKDIEPAWINEFKLGYQIVAVRGEADNREIYLASTDRAGLIMDIQIDSEGDASVIKADNVTDIYSAILEAKHNSEKH